MRGGISMWTSGENRSGTEALRQGEYLDGATLGLLIESRGRMQIKTMRYNFVIRKMTKI